MTRQALDADLLPGQGFEIHLNVEGIGGDCRQDGPCIPREHGRFGWENVELTGSGGEKFRLRNLSWPETEVSGIIMDAEKALRAGKKEFKLHSGRNVLVISRGQIPIFIQGMAGFLAHQENCPNRRCP